MKNNDVYLRAKVLAVVILLGLGCFLYWNFTTTRAVLIWTLGASAEITALAVGISLVDMAGLARLFTPAKRMQEEGLFVWILTGVWLLAVGTDVILTYFYVVWRMTLQAPEIPATVGGMYSWFPWAVALLEVGIRVPLVLLVGQYGDKLLHGTQAGKIEFSDAFKKAIPPKRTPQPVSYRKPQSNRKPTPKPNYQKSKVASYRAEDYIG